MQASVDGATTAGTSMPGRISLFTTPTGTVVGVERLRISQDGTVSFTHTAGFGYGQSSNGDGGTISQATSITTGVTLSTVCGTITLFSGARTSQVSNAFTLTNTNIGANDHLQITHVSGGTMGAYNITATCSAGSAVINVRNVHTASLTEAPVLKFTLIKGVVN
jgi:hypothetical protein